jgi:hypothetical protein
MKNDIKTILKELKRIEPDKDYAQRSKMIILASQQKKEAKLSVFSNFLKFKNIIEVARFSVVFTLVLFMLFSIISGVSYINKTFSPLSLEGLDQKSMITEAKDINNDIQLTLEEIKYLDQSNKKAINTIKELSKNEPIYSNISTSSSSTDSTSTEEVNEAAGETIQDFLIVSPTSTEENNLNTDSLLDKIAQ